MDWLSLAKKNALAVPTPVAKVGYLTRLEQYAKMILRKRRVILEDVVKLYHYACGRDGRDRGSSKLKSELKSSDSSGGRVYP